MSKIANIKLFTFPPVPEVYNISPFGIKLESYFRVNDINYQPIYTTKFSSQGTIPYIKISGHGKEKDREVSDSNVVIDYFRNEAKFIDTDSQLLTRQERATTHAIIRMLEEHTAQIGFHYRYGRNMRNFLSSMNVGENVFNSDKSWTGSLVIKFWSWFQPGNTQKKSKFRGLSRHTDTVLWKFSADDLDCLEDILAVSSSSFFFGKDKATLIDCAVFGHVSQFLWIPIDFPQKQHIKEKCPRLFEFMFAFRKKYWPDWEDKCQKKNM